MKRVLFWAGYVWAFPITITGILFAIIVGCVENHAIGPVVVFEASPWLDRVFFKRFRVAAYTWGGCITCAPEYVNGGGVLKHELVHFKQAQILGVFMPLVYGVCSLVAWAQGGNPYSDNALEKWARKESGT